MPRVKGTALKGPVRALRLPYVDAWFEQPLREEPQRSSSELLLRVMHAGLRVRSGHFQRHVAALKKLSAEGAEGDLQTYLWALADTFDAHYVQHVLACVREPVMQ